MGLSKEWFDNLRTKLQHFLNADFDGKTVNNVRKELFGFYQVYSNVVANVGNLPVFRVRRINEDDEHTTFKDVWCPPASSVKKMGRANDIGESVFYGALDYLTAIQEVDINIGEKFSLVAYNLKSRENFEMSSVVIRPSIPMRNQLEPVDLFGLELSNFMVSEFTRKVHTGNETNYVRSCAISKILLDLPNKDSLLYPSVQNKDAVNIVMKEDDANTRLSLQLVMTCQCKSSTDYVVLEVKQPDSAGNLKILYDYKKDSVPLKVNIPQMSFQKMFGDDKIPSAEQEIQELLNAFSANNCLQGTL